jgi:hypothetical protein
VEPSTICGKTVLVSGIMPAAAPGTVVPSWLRKKYWTCAPGVRIPSGRILVNSFVVLAAIA